MHVFSLQLTWAKPKNQSKLQNTHQIYNIQIRKHCVVHHTIYDIFKNIKTKHKQIFFLVIFFTSVPKSKNQEPKKCLRTQNNWRKTSISQQDFLKTVEKTQLFAKIDFLKIKKPC